MSLQPYEGYRWPKERVWELAALIESGKTDAQAAEALGTTKVAVTRVRQRAGIAPVTKQHHSAGDVARLMGVSDNVVGRWVQRGWLAAEKIGTHRQAAWRITHEALLDFIEDARYWSRWDVERITDRGLRFVAMRVRSNEREHAAEQAEGRRSYAHKMQWSQRFTAPQGEDASDFAVMMRECRVAAGLTMTDLARLMGCNHSFISYLENDKRAPTRPVVWEFAHAIGADARTRDVLLVAAGFAPEDRRHLFDDLPIVQAVYDAIQSANGHGPDLAQRIREVLDDA